MRAGPGNYGWQISTDRQDKAHDMGHNHQSTIEFHQYRIQSIDVLVQRSAVRSPNMSSPATRLYSLQRRISEERIHIAIAKRWTD
jgi:hypothetical protein